MIDEKEKTALATSVGADERQSVQTYNNIISTANPEINCPDENFEEIYRQFQRMNDPTYLHVVSMDDLYEMAFPAKQWIIEGILHTGMYILAGAPKYGKSFLVMQIAYCVSKGIQLWKYPVHQSPVLYLALEDNFSRLQFRLYRMYGVESTKDLYLSTESKKIRNGLEEQLAVFLQDHPKTKLIIIDTLKKVRECNEDSYSYAHDYDDIGILKKFADDHNICLIVVHHTRKLGDTIDQFNTISGTTGLTGAADGSLLLSKKKRTDYKATLLLTGRDVQDQEFHIIRDLEHLIWNLESVEVDEFKLPTDPVLAAVAQIVTATTSVWSGSATELADFLGLDISPISLTKHINVNKGRLEKEYSIFYDYKKMHEGRRLIFKYLQSES